MTAKVVVRQLWDENERKTPTIEDVNKSLLVNERTWTHNGEKYTTYGNMSGEKPYSPHSQVSWKNLTETYRYRIPIKQSNERHTPRKKAIDFPQLVADLYNFKEKLPDLGGEGYYNVYLMGGRKPPIEYILKAWIEKS